MALRPQMFLNATKEQALQTRDLLGEELRGQRGLRRVQFSGVY